MAYNLSVFHLLITPKAILCIIPPLSTDFVIITDMGSSYEIGRQGLILVFSKTPQIVSTLCGAYKVPPFEICSISHGLHRLISSMLPWDIAASQ